LTGYGDLPGLGARDCARRRSELRGVGTPGAAGVTIQGTAEPRRMPGARASQRYRSTLLECSAASSTRTRCSLVHWQAADFLPRTATSCQPATAQHATGPSPADYSAGLGVRNWLACWLQANARRRLTRPVRRFEGRSVPHLVRGASNPARRLDAASAGAACVGRRLEVPPNLVDVQQRGRC
jgi:hypothetical protein